MMKMDGTNLEYRKKKYKLSIFQDDKHHFLNPVFRAWYLQ